jgi:hypothetical protein
MGSPGAEKQKDLSFGKPGVPSSMVSVERQSLVSGRRGFGAERILRSVLPDRSIEEVVITGIPKKITIEY